MAKYKKIEEFFPHGEEQKLFYMKNPTKFVEHFILTGEDEYMSEPQKWVLNEIVFNKRVSVSSGRGLGKSAVSAWVIIWFIVCFPQAKISLISPSRQQLESVLYTELRKWLKRSPFMDAFELTKKKMYYKGDPSSFCELLVARKDNPEAVSGRHEENMLFIVDEASNVHDVTLNYLSDSLTDVNNHMLLMSNPTRTQGFFYDTHHERTGSGKKRVRKRWKDKIFSALESPFVDKEDIERIRAYGEHSDQWRVSVLGQFPSGSPDAFIQMEQVEKAVNNEIEFPSGKLRIGVDVAGSGTDLAVLAKAVGYKMYPLERKQRTDRADEYVDWVKSACTELRRTAGKPQDEVVIVKVDDGGVGGHFVASALEAVSQDLNIDVRPTTFGGPRDKHYFNNTARMFDHLKKIIHLMDMPNDRDLVEELSTRKYKVQMGSELSQIKMQTKDEYRREFGHSPDSGDAVLLCMWDSKNPRTVLKEFNPHDKSTVVNKLNYVGGMDSYVSLFYSRDGLASTIWAHWDGAGELILTKELLTDDNLARVASEINHYQTENTVKIIGNARCFGKHGQDIKSQLRKYKVRLKENRKYDELGAINFLNQLVSNKRLKVHKDLIQTTQQLSEWRKDTSTVKQEIDYGLCYAILNITSELKQRVEKEQKRTPQRRGYSEAPTNNSAKPWEKSYAW